MLGFYARNFRSVEMNYTFRRDPRRRRSRAGSAPRGGVPVRPEGEPEHHALLPMTNTDRTMAFLRRRRRSANGSARSCSSAHRT